MLDTALPMPAFAVLFLVSENTNLVKGNETLSNVPCLLIQNAVQNIYCHSKMLII